MHSQKVGKVEGGESSDGVPGAGWIWWYAPTLIRHFILFSEVVTQIRLKITDSLNSVGQEVMVAQILD